MEKVRNLDSRFQDWCDVMWCGVVCVVWFGVVWCGLVLCGVVWCVWFCLVWFGLVWFGHLSRCDAEVARTLLKPAEQSKFENRAGKQIPNYRRM